MFIFIIIYKQKMIKVSCTTRQETILNHTGLIDQK